MDKFSKNKVLIILVGILLLANIIMLSYWIFRPKKAATQRSTRGMMSNFLKSEIHFSDEQLKVFDSLRTAHFESMKPHFKEMNLAKENIYRQVAVGDSLKVDSFASIVGKKQAFIELAFYQHFRRVRNLCTEEQQPAFDSLFTPFMKKMTSRRK
jgi:hypothetical protein